jgi:hypothetical protein
LISYPIRILCVCLMLGNLAGIGNSGESGDTEASLKKLAKASSQLSVSYLLGAIDEENGLWVIPHYYRPTIWVKTGKFKDVKIAITKVVGYKDVWKWVHKPTDEDPYQRVYMKVKQEIRKIVGYKTEKREISKPGGKLQNTTICNRRYIEGMNCLSAYAVLEANADLANSPKMGQFYEYLYRVTEFGFADNTVELCLELLVMMKSNPEDQSSHIMKGLYKLLNGQISSGDASGLWGYYSVNWENLRIVLGQLPRIEEALKKINLPEGLELRKKISRVLKLKMKQHAELKSGLKWLEEHERSVTREFMMGRVWFKNRKIAGTPADPENWYWPGTLFDARKGRLGSLLATQVALWTIREAYQAGFLKKEGLKKFDEVLSLSLPANNAVLRMPPLPDVKRLLKNTLTAFVRSQGRDGLWKKMEVPSRVRRHPFPEMLKQQEKFNPGGNAKNVVKIKYTPFPEEARATVSALHCLALLDEIPDPKSSNVKKRHAAAIERGMAHYNKYIDELLSGAQAEALKESYVNYYPYFLLLPLPDIHSRLGTKIFKDPQGLKKLLRYACRLQNETGTFNRKYAKWFENRNRPHPLFPRLIEDKWVKEKIYTGYWEHGKVSPVLISTSLMVLFAKRLGQVKELYDSKWTTAFDEYSKLRQQLLGIEPVLYNKLKAAAEEAQKKEEEAKAAAEAEKDDEEKKAD